MISHTPPVQVNKPAIIREVKTYQAPPLYIINKTGKVIYYGQDNLGCANNLCPLAVNGSLTPALTRGQISESGTLELDVVNDPYFSEFPIQYSQMWQVEILFSDISIQTALQNNYGLSNLVKIDFHNDPTNGSILEYTYDVFEETGCYTLLETQDYTEVVISCINQAS